MAVREKIVFWILHVARFFMGGLFLYAGATKIPDPSGFAVDVQNYRLLPHILTVVFALYLPWIEVFCGIAVIVRRLYLGALGILTVLMGIFIVAIVSAWARGLDISCGCFGRHGGTADYPWLVVRDMAILGILAILAAWHLIQHRGERC